MIPTLKEAQEILDDAVRLNPGPWEHHSLWVARGARLIAEHHPALDPERAHILGLLHDIGRRCGPKGMRHVLDGYHFLNGLGYQAAARICMTHSYPDPHRPHGGSDFDGTPDEYRFLKEYLLSIEYDDYDRLIMLCDCLALPSGFCLMEKRLIDVVLRYGINEHTLPRWRSFFSLKDQIETEVGGSVYRLLPGVVETTFDFQMKWN